MSRMNVGESSCWYSSFSFLSSARVAFYITPEVIRMMIPAWKGRNSSGVLYMHAIPFLVRRNMLHSVTQHSRVLLQLLRSWICTVIIINRFVNFTSHQTSYCNIIILLHSMLNSIFRTMLLYIFYTLLLLNSQFVLSWDCFKIGLVQANIDPFIGGGILS